MARRLLLFDIFLLAALICATRLGTLVHEVLGHALAATAGGAEVDRVSLTLFAGGLTHISGAVPPGLAGRLFYLSGILANLVTGGLVLGGLYFFRKKPSTPWTLFGALFALASILGGLCYLCLASYYQAGDLSFAAGAASPWRLAWLPALLAAPAAAFLGFRAFLPAMARCFPSRGFISLALMVFLTLGLSMGAYYGLYRAEGKSLAMARSSSEALVRERAAKLAEKREALFDEIRRAHPELSSEQVLELVEKAGVTLSEAELPRPFPIVWPLLAALALGGVLALACFGKEKGGPPASLAPGAAAGALACAALILGLLAWRGGLVF